MTKEEVCSQIEEIGIIPAARVSAADGARFAAEAVRHGGIPIVEIPMTVPDAIGVISQIVRQFSDMIVGAGGLLDVKTARLCLDVGASFLTTDALDLDVVRFAIKENIAVLPGALTPTEVITAWKEGVNFVKVSPCAPLGGESYIRRLSLSFPHVPLVAAGGVNQRTAEDFILAGATALGVGRELIPKDAVEHRREHQIWELARRFLGFVKEGRARKEKQLLV
jgi:2-dehydro-3-deoxyphosphogluconate aldolase/(4S)-4-hydroxy-2-oxoglutarate aldolase